MFLACCCPAPGVVFCDCTFTSTPTTLYATVTGAITAAANGSWTLTWDAATSAYWAPTTWTYLGVTYQWQIFCRIEGGIPYPTMRAYKVAGGLQINYSYQFQQPVTGASNNTCSPFYLVDLYHAPGFPNGTAVVTA